MRVVYAGQPFPDAWTMAVFLAGPTPRSPEVPSWRPEVLALFAAAGFRGVVFVPEPASGERAPEYDDQVEWERQGLNFADRILFWVPRDLQTMPAFTTNVEFGRWCTSGKIVLGLPPSAPKNKYLAWLAGVEGVPIRYSLAETVTAVLHDGEPATERRDGERHVPLHIWRTETFQAWYRHLRQAGHRLDEARLSWVFAPHEGRVFAWVLHARVWIESEQRHKENEWVLGRPDLACTILHHRSPGADLLDTRIVLVREFRCAARTPDGFVHELPGGSSSLLGSEPRAIACAEIEEETGLRIAAERLRPLGGRQVAATLSAHHAHTFAAELSAEEMELAQRLAAEGNVAGVVADTERTFIEVATVRDILERGLTDWATVGMVMHALQ
jgi:8-oxo-dGTP pyrophosphatase MutT (NUDIX family)